MTDPYRDSARSEEIAAAAKAHWHKRYWYLVKFCAVAFTCVVAAGAGVGVERRVAHVDPPKPPPPYVCQDSAEVVSIDSYANHPCGPDQTMDTTRIYSDARILVRCWCPGHQPKGEQ